MAILVAEDDPYYRAGVKSILQKEGSEVLEADDGIAGYGVLRKPFTRQALMDAVRKGIAEAAFLREPNESAAPWHQDPRASRLELEQHWRAQVQKTKEQYNRYKLQFRLTLAEHGPGHTPAADGSFASHRALVQESAALRDYALSVRILHDIMTSGDRLGDTEK